MGTIKEAREIFSHDRYATVLSGAYIEEIGENYAKCSMKITEDHRNAYGGIMGGCIYRRDRRKLRKMQHEDNS